jgi:hypothetical protein
MRLSRLVARARRRTAECGFAAAAIDGPGHLRRTEQREISGPHRLFMLVRKPEGGTYKPPSSCVRPFSSVHEG